MSDSIIKDGTGTGSSAMVGDKNRLHTHALVTTAASNATVEGDAFNVSSELITLTSANDSALLYIKNNEDHSISVTTLFVNLGASTGGSGESLISFQLAPTGGTLISDETAAQTLNRNIGNNTTLTAAAYKGAEGKTITGGSTVQLPSTGGPIASEYVLPKGAAFSLSITPPTGNTSMQVQIGFLVVRNYESYTIE
jgi:hypothetical protein